jgi:hypothetical protein
VRVALRAGTLGLGPNLATGLVDLSEDGLCVLTKSPLKVGSEAEVCLDKAGSQKPLKFVAEVRWCNGDEASGYRVGLRLRHRIQYTQIVDFTQG